MTKDLKSTLKEKLQRLSGKLTPSAQSLKTNPAHQEFESQAEAPKPEAMSDEQRLDIIARLRETIAGSVNRPSRPQSPLSGIYDLSREQQIEMQTPYGPCLVMECRLPLTAYYGAVALEDLVNHPLTPLAVLESEPAVSTAAMKEFVFFDTETTGLAGGTGTYIFLLGLGYFEDNAFCVKQIFMRDYAEEPALLWLTGQVLSGKSVVVTYNGKCFDVPLLRTRLIAARNDQTIIPTLHLDLLYGCRRLWREKHGSCKLTNLESRILNVERRGDIPGELIPQIYFEFLRTGVVDQLRNVFIHNRYDIISLAGLLLRILQILADPDRHASPDEFYSLGKIYRDQGLVERADACFVKAMEGHTDPGKRAEAAIRRWLMVRARRQYTAGLPLLKGLMASGGWAKIYACHELAKYYEHHRQDYQTALELAMLALQENSESDRVRAPTWIALPSREAWEYRRARLERFIARPKSQRSRSKKA